MVISLGLINAPVVFQTLLKDIFRDFLNIFVFVYLDDTLIYSQDMQEHTQHVRTVLQRLYKNRFVKAEKCMFHVSAVSFLGFIIEGRHYCTDLEKIKAVVSGQFQKRENNYSASSASPIFTGG